MEGDAHRAFQPGGEPGNGIAAFHPALMRAPEPARKGAVGQHRAMLRGQIGGGEQRAVRPHAGGAERFQHGHRLGAARGDKQALMLHPDARLRCDLGPDIARPHRAPPAVARLLPGHGDKAEVAHRGTDRLCLAVNHRHRQAQPPRRQRMRQPNNPRTNHDKVKSVRHRFRHA